MSTNLSLDERINAFHLLKHPFYQAWMKGELSLGELRDYAGQYYSHVGAFPRYLGAIHSNCEDATARRQLLENLNDEEGRDHGVSHPELWLQFAAGLGLAKEEARQVSPRPAIQAVVDTFFHYARSSYHEGLAALYAYEAQVPEVAQSKIEGLERSYGIHDASTLAFFRVHVNADLEHRAQIRSLLDALPDGQKAEAAAAAEAAAKSLWNFLSDVHAGCEAAPCVAPALPA